MKKIIYPFILMSLLVHLTGCATLFPVRDPNKEYVLAKAVSFKFAMNGNWNVRTNSDYELMVQKDITPTYISRLALVRLTLFPEAIQTPTSTLGLKYYKQLLINDAKKGNLQEIEQTFKEDKHQGADCIFYTEKANRKTFQGASFVKTNGIVCAHPHNQRMYVWAIISDQRPVAWGDIDLSQDRKILSDSLTFLK